MKFQKIITIALLSLITICSFAQQSDVVYATGSGYSEMSALKDAYRNAVAQKVAMLIESSTIVLDEEVIEDKIIAVSAGFVNDMEVVVPAKVDSSGLYTVTVKAEVLHNKIITAMKASSHTKSVNIKTVKVKSESNVSAQEEMGNFLIKAIDVYINTWNFEVINTRTNKNDDSSFVVEIRGTLSENDYINKFYKPLDKKLVSMGAKKTSSYDGKGKSPYIEVASNLTTLYSIYYYIPLLKADAIEAPFKDYISNILDKYSYILRIEAKDKNNEVLATKDVFLMPARDGFGFSVYSDSIVIKQNYGVSLDLSSDKKSVYCRAESKAFNINVGADIDRVESVSITVLMVEKSSPTDDKWN